MTALPPDQLQALQAVIAQQAPALAEEISQSIAVTVQNAPIDLEKLLRFIQIEGTATKQGASLDQLLVRTGQGDFLLRIPDGARQQLLDSLPSRVVLQLRPGPNGLEAILVVGTRASQEANKVEQSLASNNTSARQTLTSEIPKVGQVFQVAVLPSTLTSNLLNPQNRGAAQQPIADASVAPNNPNLSPLNAALAAINPNAPQIAAIKENTAPPTPQIGTDIKKDDAFKLPLPNTNSQSVPLQTAPAESLRPQLIPLRVLNVELPNTAQQSVPTPTIQADKTLTAIVRGTTPSGQPIVTINDDVAVVNTIKNWPTGTKIQIALGAGAELVTAKEVSPLPSPFENLRQVTELLAQQNPILFNEIKHTRIPQALTGQVSGPLLFFLVALQKGNVNQWLGEDVKNFLQGTDNAPLLQKLQDEFLGSKQPAVDTAGSAWRGITVPYLDADKMQQFRFYVHEDTRGQQQQSEREFAKRFLIDMSLSRLGNVQIDGLVQQKKLDVIVRTVAHLDESLRNDLRMRFTSAMEEIRYTGSLIFQPNKQGWVELKTAHSKGVEKAI